MAEDWQPGDGSAADYFWLADWRRQIAGLYADVRSQSAADPEAAHDHWRRERERLFRDHPQSPVPPDARATFRAIHFEYDPALRFSPSVQPAPPDAPGSRELQLPNSGTDTLAFTRIGRAEISFGDRPRQLSIFWMAGYAGGLIIPFRDATNGTETYGAGRYLVDTGKSADLGGDPSVRTLILDFNFAFQPSCAFDPRWACPLAPPENRLDIPVRAGERLTGDPPG